MPTNARRGAFMGRDPVARFEARFRAPEVEMRTRYETTLTTPEAAFAPGDVFYVFYETLFCEAELRRLTGFLGIEHMAADFSLQVNASPGETEPDPPASPKRAPITTPPTGPAPTASTPISSLASVATPDRRAERKCGGGDPPPHRLLASLRIRR